MDLLPAILVLYALLVLISINGMRQHKPRVQMARKNRVHARQAH